MPDDNQEGPVMNERRRLNSRNIPHLPIDILAWLSSGTITAMTNAEEGVYARLIIHSWNYPDCTLPDDINHIRKLAKKAPEKMVQKVLSECFRKTEHGWRNEKIFEVFLNVLSRSDLASKAAKCRKNKETHRADAKRTLSGRCSGKTAEAQQTETLTKNILNKESKDMASPSAPPLTDVYKFAMEKFWNDYPHRHGVKQGKAATESNIKKYVKPDELEDFLKATKNFRDNPNTKEFIGIPDPERWVFSAKKKSQPWREWINIVVPQGGNGNGQNRNSNQVSGQPAVEPGKYAGVGKSYNVDDPEI